MQDFEIISTYIKILRQSESTKELSQAITKLKSLYSSGAYNDLKDKFFVLLNRMSLKLRLLQYMESNKTKEEGLKIISYIEKIEEACLKKDSQKTALSAHNAIYNLNLIIPIMDDISKFYSIKDTKYDNTPLIEALNIINDKISKIEPLTMNIVFDSDVKIKDLKLDALDVLSSLKNDFEALIQGNKLDEMNSFYDKLKGQFPKDIFTYGPSLSSNENSFSNSLIIHSPFSKEIDYLLISISKQNKLNFSLFYGFDLEKLKENEIKLLLDVARDRNDNLYIKDLDSKESNSALLHMLLLYGREGHRVYFSDSSATNDLYNLSMDTIKKSNDLSFLDVSYYYLTMPNYDQLINILKEKKMIDGDNQEIENEIREKMPFIGFKGLNEIIISFISKQDWIKKGERISKTNFNDLLKDYIERLPNLSLLIDQKWNFIYDKPIDENKKDFDYDIIKERNEVNIRKIVDSPYNMFEKAGALAKYCLLNGDDVSIWKDLDFDDIEKRINTTVKYIYNLFGLDMDVEVKIVTKLTDGYEDCIGLCCLNGKLIYFSKKIVKSFSDIFDTILHECFHSFQHFSIAHEYKKWYFKDLGLTKGRIDEWNYSFNEYYYGDDYPKYRHQVVEADANSFAKDATRESEKIWNLIDFE